MPDGVPVELPGAPLFSVVLAVAPLASGRPLGPAAKVPRREPSGMLSAPFGAVGLVLSAIICCDEVGVFPTPSVAEGAAAAAGLGSCCVAFVATVGAATLPCMRGAATSAPGAAFLRKRPFAT